MLRVREKAVRAGVRGGQSFRMAAMAGLGIVLGAGGVIGAVTIVQAEDDAGIRAFHRQEAENSRAARNPAGAAHTTSSAYAPARPSWRLPLLETRPDGRIAHPPVNLNPFAAQPAARPGRRDRSRALDATAVAVSGQPRTICVRLCDGFHSPIGLLGSSADMRGHEALCQAANPGVPVKVFRVAAGATSIDDAVSADGRSTYGALPMAHGHARAADPACRAPIVAEGERRVSLLRDITLRPGDSVVLDGRVRTFAGSSRWPYSPRDFRDFRAARELNAKQRKDIDTTVGVSHREAQTRALQRHLRVREAALRDETGSDALTLRGALEPSQAQPVRVVRPSPYRP